MNHSSDKQKWGAWGVNNSPKNHTNVKNSISYEYSQHQCNTPFFKNNLPLGLKNQIEKFQTHPNIKSIPIAIQTILTGTTSKQP